MKEKGRELVPRLCGPINSTASGVLRGGLSSKTDCSFYGANAAFGSNTRDPPFRNCNEKQ